MNLFPYAAVTSTLVFAAGYAYEKVSAYRDAKAYPPPGELLDIGGYQLHVRCQGEARAGVPTVIIETGIFDCSESWQLVQPEIAKFTKVCSYDRLGYGWSDKSSCPRTFKQIVFELKKALTLKGLKPPFIFVGHSLGGPLVRSYQSQYPEDVTGIIFVDTVTDYKPQLSKIFLTAARALSYLSLFGVTRILFKLSPAFSSNIEWTSTMQKTYIAAHFAKPTTLATCFAESDAMEESFKSLRIEKRTLTAIPVTIISRDPELPQRPGMSEMAIKEMRHELEEQHRKMRAEIGHAKFVIAKGSNHMVQLDRPEIIVQEVLQMIHTLSR